MAWTLCIDDRDRDSSIYAPLDPIHLAVQADGDAQGLEFTVTDGAGHLYLRRPASELAGGSVVFTIRGALGTHVARVGRPHEAPLAELRLPVDARTAIRSGSGRVQRFYDILESEIYPETTVAETTRFYSDGKIVRFYVHWMRDDTHNKKAFKYWENEVKSLPEVFLDLQKPNGMVFDLFNYPIEHGYYYRESTWGEPFTGYSANGRIGWCRIPVEADVEYLTVESVYVSWQATGDDRWMERLLPKLEKAMDYMMSDPLRWDPQHALVKRGFTIDTWDFQHRAAFTKSKTGGRNLLGAPDHMWADEGTPWCIMHGDNSGMYQACRQIETLHRHLGHADQADAWAAKADQFRANTDKVCWNGQFYTHQVHLTPIEADFGVDESRILSLSNPYDMTRGLPDHAKCVSIIQEYQRRREETRDWSFAEWFTIHPFFGDRFGGHLEPGEYMNGSITTIVAGELARAAFWHGHEAYGADILDRLIDLQARDGHLHVAYHPSGKQLDWVTPEYTPLSLAGIANRGFDGTKPDGWTGEGENDLHDCPTGRAEFLEVPFEITDPASNNGHGCLMLQGAGLGHLPASATLPVGGQKARSVYILHTSSGARNGEVAGWYELQYADGTRERKAIIAGRHVAGWWVPKKLPDARAVYHGKNAKCADVGFYMLGWENPRPDKEIVGLEFSSAGNGALIVLGTTLSSGPVRYPWGNVSGGIPDNWGSAAVLAAVVEGLAGVTDNLKVFEDVNLAPRWLAAGEDQARVTVRYGASQGYAAYDYRREADAITLDYSGSGETFRFHVMLPAGMQARAVTHEGQPVAYENTAVEQTPYADFTLTGRAGGTVRVEVTKA